MALTNTPQRGDVDLVHNIVRSIGGVQVLLANGASGAPTTGHHISGEIHTDKAGTIHACTVTGQPGTWVTQAVNGAAGSFSTMSMTGKQTTYNSVATAGLGMAAVYGYNRTAGATTAVASVVAFTPAADSSLLVSANVNVTTATTHNFTVTCTYTDEASNSRTLTMGFTQLSGATFLTAITNITGAGPYESMQYHIRVKASTAVTIATTGTFTAIVYNVEGAIVQVA